jgi:hypothetical protein
VVLEAAAPEGSFDSDADYLNRLRAWGVTEIVAGKLHWHSPAVPRPAQGPPDPAAGGSQGWNRLLVAAGGNLAPALDLTVTVPPCPDRPSPLYRDADRLGDGAAGFKWWPERPATCTNGDDAPEYLLAPDAALRLAASSALPPGREQSAAVWLDHLATWNPAYPFPGAGGNLLDRAAPPTHPATVGEAVAAVKRVLASLQRSMGPVLATGSDGLWELGYDSFYAGYLDGAWRSLATGSPDRGGGSRYLVVPDYELGVVRPRMANFGMGPYGGFFDLEAEGDAAFPLSDERLDELRATSLAYGHAAAWSRRGSSPEYLTDAETVKEYYLMRPLSRRMLEATSVRVRYVAAGGSQATLSEALAADSDLGAPRLYLTFDGTSDGALELWINHSRDNWDVQVGPERLTLAPHGWAAIGDGGRLYGYSALRDGRVVDYLTVPEHTLMDGRGQETVFGPRRARDLWVDRADGLWVVEAPDGSLEVSAP